jgi:putative heme-binding domain-containing protein
LQAHSHYHFGTGFQAKPRLRTARSLREFAFDRLRAETNIVEGSTFHILDLTKLRKSACTSLLVVVMMFVAGSLRGQQPTKPGERRGSGTAAKGAEIFASHCTACHGLDGLGTERAPNIATRPEVTRKSDTALAGIVHNGVPGTGMPSFRMLTASEIKSLVAHLRTLSSGAGSNAKLPGNPANGKTIFFGEGGCSGCHMVNGAGGFIGPDLSGYAREHAPDDIKAAITDYKMWGSGGRTIEVIAADGQHLRGVVRNEDNFSLQLQSIDGAFHFLAKADLQKIDRSPQPIMPTDYGVKLTSTQLNDLVSYLIDAARASLAIPSSKGDEHKADE